MLGIIIRGIDDIGTFILCCVSISIGVIMLNLETVAKIVN